jgi:hypothetical protein
VHSFYGDHPKFPTKNLPQSGRKENGYAYGDCVLVFICRLSMCWVGELFEDVSFAFCFFLPGLWVTLFRKADKNDSTDDAIFVAESRSIQRKRRLYKVGQRHRL